MNFINDILIMINNICLYLTKDNGYCKVKYIIFTSSYDLISLNLNLKPY